MFDFGKITDTIGGLLSGAQQQAEQGSGVTDLLAQAGIDPALLDGLSQDEILALLQQYGIDPSQLDTSQIADLLQQSGMGGNLSEMAADWLRSRQG